MSGPKLSYGVVTPARNDGGGVQRLAEALATQDLLPQRWVLVENGSSDDTGAVADALAAEHPWMRVVHVPATPAATRATPIVGAFTAGLAQLGDAGCDVVMKIDADISFEPGHVARLLEEFEHDARLGIASGVAYEQGVDGVWRQRHGTGPGVWGACRAYRRECLEEVLPLENRMGWDTIDLVTARVRGWETRVLSDLPFLHHRAEGARDGAASARWRAQGRAAHYMGYRVSYLIAKTVFRGVREPAAVGVVVGFAAAALRREPRHPDASVRQWVRGEQRVRRLPVRVREALRPRRPLGSGVSPR